MIDVGNGQPVLMIHGLGTMSSYFLNQLKLSSNYRLMSFDLLGHGFNPSTAQITLENMAKDQWKQVDQKGIDRITICGHSLGGLVAQEMYKQQPKRVKSLILANTYSYCIPCFSAMELFVRQFNFATLSTNDYTEHIIDNCLYDRKNETLREQARQSFLIRNDSYMAACHAGAYANYRKLLPEITVPTLIISSSNDQVTKPFVHDDMHQRIRGSKLITIKHCGHLSNIEKPYEFNAAIREFMNG